MKTRIDAWKNRLALFVAMMLSTVYTFAQEQGLDVAVTKTSTTTSNWYTEPWVWIVGGLVFVLLLAALLSGGRSSRRVNDGTTIHRTTVTRRDDVLDA